MRGDPPLSMMQKKTSNTQRPTSNAERRLARRIAKQLFTDGFGDRAVRLVFEYGSADLKGTGWCESAVADRIEKNLRSSAQSADKKSGGAR